MPLIALLLFSTAGAQESETTAMLPDGSPGMSIWHRYSQWTSSESPALGRHLDTGFVDGLAEGVSLRSDESDILALDWTESLYDLKYDTWRHEGNRDEYKGAVSFRLEDTLVKADRVVRDMDAGEVLAEGNVSLVGEKSNLTADRLRYRFDPDLVGRESESALRSGTMKAERVRLIEPHREIRAPYLEYNFGTGTGDLIAPQGRAGALYFGAERMRILGANTFEGDKAWVSTCDESPPHYRLKVSGVEIQEGRRVLGDHARLQLGRAWTPVYLPRFRRTIYDEDQSVNYDFGAGHDAGVGFWYNMGIWKAVTPNLDLALRLLPTTDEGFAYGIDGRYDYRDSANTFLSGARGDFHTLYTTNDRGYWEYYHQQRFSERTRLTSQLEQWSDRDFVKDFFFDSYERRTGPRTFVDITHAGDAQIASLSTSVSTHDFLHGTEQLPEFSYHLLERRLFQRFYFSFDSTTGHYDSAPLQAEVVRADNVARLSWDMNLHEAFNITPFAQIESTWYSDGPADPSPDYRVSGTSGVTAQSRVQRGFGGFGPFAGFKHIVLPSVTFLHRPKGTLDPGDVHRFDAIDDRPARSRIESKLDNVVLARDAETAEVWEVLRATFYHGSDFWNETSETEEYEALLNVRPRPWWDLSAEWERGDSADDVLFAGTEYDILAASVGFDVPKWNGRVGYNDTNWNALPMSRELRYSLGYKFTGYLSAWFQHRYDLDREELTWQEYELRSRFHRWETSVRYRQRETGFDVQLNIALLYAPGGGA